MLNDAQFCELVRVFGAERILFGTDSPWDDMQKSVERICALPLTADKKLAIFSGNALRLLGEA